MLTRLTHAAITFAATVVVYQMYVLAVVPFVDPSSASAAPSQIASPQERAKARQAVHKHRELLAAYFPPGHWTLASPPITFETGKAMFVLDDYQPNDNGQVRVKKCAILFFPRERVLSEPPPRDAIVLEAPHGAVLQMDGGLRSGLGGFGRMQWGKLMGEIFVRSDMREPGPEDDLLLTTRDLYLNEDLIRTDAQVDMRLGPHRGRGRVLEIRLVAIERAQSRESGPSLGGIDSLEILREVEAQFSPGKMQLFGESKQEGPSKASPPVKVTSKGPFRFDFAHQVASFSKQVKLTQVHPEGQIDQLLSEKLNFYFSKNEDADRPSAEEASESTLRGFQPALIEAIGSPSAPVSLDSQSQQATVRCQRMRVELQARRVTLDQGEEVMLTYQGSEIHARQVRYQAPPPGTSYRVGTLLAAGHGWMRSIASGQQASNPFEVRWTNSMQLERINGKPVLSLHGRPRIEMVGIGRLWADAMTLDLRERAVDNPGADLLPGDIVPERMVARGKVAIETPELSGKVNQLEVQVDYAPINLVLGQANGNDSRTGRPTQGQRLGKQGRTYQVVGNQLQMLLTVRARRPEVTRLEVVGDVVFRESASAGETVQPLVVQGNHLRVENADMPSAEFRLQGQPATITAAGMSIRAAVLRMNRGSSKAWVDSPGELHLPIKKDFSGKPLAGLQFLVVRWKGGMQFDQNLATFHGNVVANTNDGSLHTERMRVMLTTSVRFDGASGQQPTELAQLECQEGVVAEFKQRDSIGLVSVQKMKLQSFVANQQTGQLRGKGPGELESVHLASNSSSLSTLASSAPLGRSSAQRLRFLRVQFKRDVRGNLHRRQVEVSGDAQAIYGPVDSWQQRLEISVRNAPGPETVLISSDRLAVAESPLGRATQGAGLGPIELSAVGNVTIEGSFGERGLFTTSSHTARYDQQKTMFVLEGDGQRPATLTRQEYVGAPFSETAFHKLIYIQATGEVKGEGFVGGRFKQIGTGR